MAQLGKPAYLGRMPAIGTFDQTTLSGDVDRLRQFDVARQVEAMRAQYMLSRGLSPAGQPRTQEPGLYPRQPSIIEGMGNFAMKLGLNPRTTQTIEQAAEFSPLGTLSQAFSADNPADFAMAMAPGPPKPGIKVFHASPHDFDKFKITDETLRSGEGGNTYGAGGYFAESEAVSGRGGAYDKFFSAKMQPSNWDDPKSIAAYWVNKYGDRKQATDYLEALSKRLDQYPKSYRPEEKGLTEEAIRIIKSDEELPKLEYKSHIYEAELQASPDDFLDWDGPLPDKLFDSLFKNPPESVDKYEWKKALVDAHYLAGDHAINQAGGVSAYKKLAEVAGGEAQLSKLLNERGIKGIRYLDAGSRGNVNVNDMRGTISMLETAVRKNPKDTYLAEQLAAAKKQLADAESGQSRNYVVFDDNIINIIKKYGIAGLIAGGVGAAALGGDEAQASELEASPEKYRKRYWQGRAGTVPIRFPGFSD